MMTDNIMVSICCSAFNHAEYIEKCLNGFLAQKTNFDFEILVNDDASSDGTDEILRKFEQEYPDKFKIEYHEVNQYSKGLKPWMSFLFPRAKGKYIAICEGDDYWIDPFKLQKQVDFLESNEEYGVVYTDVNFYYQNSRSLEQNVFQSGKVTLYDDFNSFFIHLGYRAPCTWLFRSNLISMVDVDNKSKDVSFVLMLEFMKISKVKFMNFTSAVYRVIQESASHSTSLRKVFERSKGLYDSQIEYIERNKMDVKLVGKVKSSTYPMLIFPALALQDRLMIEELKHFYRKESRKRKNIIYNLVLNSPKLSGVVFRILYKFQGYKF